MRIVFSARLLLLASFRAPDETSVALGYVTPCLLHRVILVMLNRESSGDSLCLPFDFDFLIRRIRHLTL